MNQYIYATPAQIRKWLDRYDALRDTKINEGEKDE